MDLSTTALFVVVALLAINQLAMRLRWAVARTVLFFSVQALLLAAGTWVLGFGLPGFDHIPAVSYVIGLLFFLHVARNLALRSRVERELAREHQDSLIADVTQRMRDKDTD